MPKRKLQANEAVEALRACLETGSDAQALDCLRGALRDSSSFVVAKAATFAAERLAHELLPELCTAFERLAGGNAQRVDTSCAAKNAIARALYELDYDDAGFYRRFLHFRQLVPGHGEATDVAVDLRSTCALGLVSTADPDAVLELVTLLDDPEWHARAGAVRALEQVDPFHAQIVLRQKILHGDEEPEVIAQCFSSLLKAPGEDALPFALARLRGSDRLRQEAAALALGESRLEAALPPLIELCESLSPRDPRTRILFQAVALQRRERAIRYLLGAIAEAPGSRAACAAEAPSIYNYDEQLHNQVRAIAAERKLRSLDDVIAAHWHD